MKNLILAFMIMLTTNAYGAAVAYRVINIDGVNIAYRETGAPKKPAILLLHGVPSSSRMYDGLLRKLGDKYHLVAPDYPGFGNSDAPDPARFTYTFDNFAVVMQKFANALGLRRYVLFMQDYGAPVGMRMVLMRPDTIRALVFQNGNIYEDGLGAMWGRRKPYWANRAAHETAILAEHRSLAIVKARHLGSDPNVEAYDPDLWMDELAYLHRPGQEKIQAELIYDYRTNLASYPKWQHWLKEHRPPTLVIWGKYDLNFLVPSALAFQRDVPSADIHILDGGHFVMDTRLDETARLTEAFVDRLAP